jgi:hypothetical protein
MPRKTLTPEDYEKRKDLYITVGQGISNWARMERKIIHVVAYIMDCNVDKAGIVFYSIINFNVWLTIIEDLLSLDPHLGSSKTAWTKITSRLRELNKTRARLAHHTVWHSRHEVGLLPALEDHRRESKKHLPLQASEIIAFTKATTQLGTELDGFLARLRSARITL